MTRFRTLKHTLERLLLPPEWPEDAQAVPGAVLAVGGMEAVSPLLALLPRGGLLKWRAAIVLGRVVAAIAEGNREEARTVMRRCMWHMNEDSGNMGWGVAEAMGEIAAMSQPLAAEYGKVVLSYARDLGFADNYVDHAALRRGTYWAIGRFAPLYPKFRAEGAELLLAGLGDEDGQCRGVAAWGLGKAVAAGGFMHAEEREMLAERLRGVANQDVCEVLDGLLLRVEPATAFSRQALHRLTGSRGS